MRRGYFAVIAGGVLVGLGFGIIATRVQSQQAPVAEGAVKATSTKTVVKKAVKPASPKPPLIEARAIFGALGTPAPMQARAIGFYARGCLAGAAPLPIDGSVWQAMRLSRNRNWGHPAMINLIERLGADAKAKDGWPGLLVGDISQPRGGPMLSGHASHQVGLDADVWLTPMPDRRLTEQEREDLAATSMLGEDEILVDPKVWTAAHGRLIARAASYPEVERVLVHPGIKKALCDAATTPAEKAAISKVRPYWGHYYHMHIRIACPKDSASCQAQPPVPANDHCGREVNDWLATLRKNAARAALRPKVPVDPNAKTPPPKPGMGLDQLPTECRTVIDAGAPGTLAEAVTKAKEATAAAKAMPK